LLFAFSALPVLIALAVGLIEPERARQRVIAAFGVLAAGVAIALTTAMFSGTLDAAIDGRHIEYSVDAAAPKASTSSRPSRARSPRWSCCSR
jgi:hypothetical protein